MTRRWNDECAKTGLLQESHRCTMIDLSKMELQPIAEKLDLPSQVSLRQVNMHVSQALQGDLQYTKGFAIPEHLNRCHQETFALNGMDLLTDLPDCFDPALCHVVILYHGLHIDEVTRIRYNKHLQQYGVRVTYYDNYQSDGDSESTEDSDGTDSIRDDDHKYVRGHTNDYSLLQPDTVLFEKECDRAEVIKIMCNAPFRLKEPQHVDATGADEFQHEVSVRISLHTKRGCDVEREDILDHFSNKFSDEPLGTSEGQVQGAEFCHKLMKACLWSSASLYFVFPDEHYAYQSCYKLNRNFLDRDGDCWTVNWFKAVKATPKVNFSCFPANANEVVAHFDTYLPAFEEVRWNIVDICLQLCEAEFV